MTLRTSSNSIEAQKRQQSNQLVEEELSVSSTPALLSEKQLDFLPIKITFLGILRIKNCLERRNLIEISQKFYKNQFNFTEKMQKEEKNPPIQPGLKVWIFHLWISGQMK